MHRAEPLWHLVQQDPIVRWSSVAGVFVLWFAIAWLEPFVLLLLPALALGAHLLRRYRLRDGRILAEDDDIDLL
jgi:hypothetical protein